MPHSKGELQLCQTDQTYRHHHHQSKPVRQRQSLLITIIGLIVVWVPFIWVAVRSIVSLINAQKQEPMPDPKSWLI